MALDCVGVQSVDHINRMFHLTSKDFNVSVSSIKRTGHARFRRAPLPSISSQSEYKQQTRVQHAPSVAPVNCFSNKYVNETTSSTCTSSVLSSGRELEGSVSNGKQFSSLGIVAPAPTFSSRKPPLPSTHRKRCIADRPVASVHVSQSGCHCCKRRKSGSKREVRRVPINGSKITSIPADDFSWKKYGEKKLDGSLYPRVYYKCSTGNGCPARKRVELDRHQSKMLLVTYDGEHRHFPAPVPLPTTLTAVVR
ncbi:probable WRKY transcription factor 11 [Rutidosis leptorrhynchoides]|uniref:probable WRKY transcription factor 11 n=1 Tax=Rutidosis leptorrhynchoides TaxID=125765 RepID=UPI003A9904E5